MKLIDVVSTTNPIVVEEAIEPVASIVTLARTMPLLVAGSFFQATDTSRRESELPSALRLPFCVDSWTQLSFADTLNEVGAVEPLAMSTQRD